MKALLITVCAILTAADLLLLSMLLTGRPDWFFAKRPPRDLDVVGIQPGQKMTGIPLESVQLRDGSARDASEFWRDKPALVMTASITCPLARKNLAGFERLRREFGSQVNFVVVYLIEAHPDNVASPYDVNAEEPWLTEANRTAGILRAQPQSLAERQQLAAEFAALPDCNAPVWVDRMDNRFWAWIGRASNLGLLIDQGGMVLARTGWFDEARLHHALQQRFGASGDATRVVEY